MYCNHCGRPVAEGSGFCNHCGAVLEGAEVQSHRQLPPSQSQTEAQRQAPRPQIGHQPQSNFRQPHRQLPDDYQSQMSDHHREPYPPQPSRQPQSDYQPPYPSPSRPQTTQRQPSTAPTPRSAPIPPHNLWIERDDALGALMRYFHAKNHERWKMLSIGAAIVCGLSLFLPWYTFSLFGGFQALDFLNIFSNGIRSPDWPIISIACVAIVVTLYLGHPLWALGGCVFLCYFAVSNLMSLFWSIGFMQPSLGFFIYFIAALLTTFGCVSAGGLEELNLLLPPPSPTPAYGTGYGMDYGQDSNPGPAYNAYPDPSNPHIPRRGEY